MTKPRHWIVYTLYLFFCFSSGTATRLLGFGEVLTLLVLLPGNMGVGFWLNRKGYFG